MKRDVHGWGPARREARERKKPYEMPTLIIHGDALEITKALEIGGSDGQGGSQQGDFQGEGG